MQHIFFGRRFMLLLFLLSETYELIAYCAISQKLAKHGIKDQSCTIYLHKYIQFKLFNLTEWILCKYFWNLCGHLSDPYDNCNNIIKFECVVVILLDYVGKIWESGIALLRKAIIAVNEIIKEESEGVIININWRIKKRYISHKFLLSLSKLLCDILYKRSC